MSGRGLARAGLALFYGAAGVLHLVMPAPFVSIVPPWVPQPGLVVLLTGLAEIAGAAGLAQPVWPKLRRAAGIGLALYALCVWPANVHHMMMDLARTDGGGAGLGYHIPRMFAQPLIIWLALWAGNAIDWPWRRKA